MGSPGPARGQRDLADMVEMLLDKGVVINADIAVTVGETELLGVHVRAALASFETAAEYGLEFPEGTDMDRVETAASGRSSLRSVEASSGAGAEDEEGHADEASTESAGADRISVRPQATSEDDDAQD